ncbi:MAG: uracil-DNA glycosylase family protein [Bacteroidota bacterium]
MKDLLKEIRACEICKTHLPNKPNPIVAVHQNSKIAIIGQAPGRIVDETGIPWDDKSGERLRTWMGIDKTAFYNEELIALIPMGFCYPGKGKSGDLPPRKECAPQWHGQLFNQMKKLELIILIGSYSQNYYYFKESNRPTLTEIVKNFREYLPKYFMLPHPSPRNNIWLKKNPWFEEDLLPVFREKVSEYLR